MNKNSTSRKKREMSFWLNKETRFRLPRGLQFRKSKEGAQFLVWTAHPWVQPGFILRVADIPPLREEIETTLKEKTRPSIKRRAKELATSSSRSSSPAVAKRTRGWRLAMPQSGKQRETLTEVCPACFLIYEVVPRKTWGPNHFKVLPKFPIVRHMPRSLSQEGKPLSKKQKEQYLAVDPRGLNAAYNRARQHYAKYGSSLLTLIQKLQTKMKQVKNR